MINDRLPFWQLQALLPWTKRVRSGARSASFHSLVEDAIKSRVAAVAIDRARSAGDLRIVFCSQP